MDVVERVFLSIIKDRNSHDIRYVMDKNIDLATLTGQYADHLIKVARTFLFLYKSRSGELNIDNLLMYLEDKRPDIYREIINHPNGKRWLRGNIKQFKKLLGM